MFYFYRELREEVERLRAKLSAAHANCEAKYVTPITKNITVDLICKIKYIKTIMFLVSHRHQDEIAKVIINQRKLYTGNLFFYLHFYILPYIIYTLLY